MTSAEQKISEARSRLDYARPYYASGAYALKTIVTEDVVRMAVDEWWRLYVNPRWVATQEIGVLATSLAHELQHLLLDHCGRAKTVGVSVATMREWNEGADCDIDDGLDVDCKSCRPVLPILPDWCIRPSTFGLPDDRSAEWYYAQRVSKLRQRRAEGGDEDGGAGDGGSGHTGDGRGLDFGCGSGSTSVPAPWEVGSPEESGVDGVDAAGAWEIRRRVAEAVKNHEQQKGRGSVPAALVDWSDELLRVKPLPWDNLLAHALRRAGQTTAGAVRQSYSRTSRRQDAFRPVIMPAFRRPIPNVTLVTDTSDSMLAQRKVARGVVDDACRALGVPLRVLDVDAAVHRTSMVTSGRKTVQIGGGGTDMRVGIEQALARPRPADCVVVVSDCDTPWPDQKPSAHVIVVAVGATAQALARIPTWATKIEATTP